MTNKVIIALLISAALTGCNEDNSNQSSLNQVPNWLPKDAPVALNEQQLVSFSTRAASGLTPAQIDEINRIGYVKWLDNQFESPVRLHLQKFEAAKDTIGNRVPVDGCKHVHYGTHDIREGIWWDALLYGNDQLRHRAAFALSQILVVSQKDNPINGRNPQSLVAFYDILQKHAFGNYRDLLEEVTLSPSMGAFLSMANSKKHDPKRGTYPDENYAREVMQLFTIGLYELNPDGTAKTDKDGNPISSYTQDDVQEVARAFSGWTYSDKMTNPDGSALHGEGYIKPMIPLEDKRGTYHDEGEKRVINNVIAAGQTPLEDIQSVLDILFAHSNTAPFVSRQLIQRMVTSNPSPEYVERVAAVFTDNGNGVRGDLKSVFAAILLDPEALNPEVRNGMSQPESYPVVKMKEPILAVAEVLRILGAKTQGNYEQDAYSIINNVNQGLHSANSVFNFYSPDFMPSGPLMDSQLYAPEFEILPWAGFIGYQNTIRTYIVRSMQENRCDNAVYINVSEYQAAAKSDDVDALPDLINQRFLAGKMSAELYASIANAAAVERHPNNKVMVSLLLVTASPEFLIQR
ncbi:DUF1800 domain-containing protein [Vibrio alfacsensis]|uniref:DUF1800 domain-containing protein n=1 Tax=Vibrio alfacsensis TaxID=1074311 RepID=A0ABM6YZ87_9VIBR|nr:DUF1800 domain-containing protein [Vibrio alfacsensis]AXY03131.1 DUF1800 domain-containing protein [Vibrio alfacsensis]